VTVVDAAAAMVLHKPIPSWHSKVRRTMLWCAVCRTLEDEPCETYRMAQALAQVEVLRVLWDGDTGTTYTADEVANMLHRALTGTHRSGEPVSWTVTDEHHVWVLDPAGDADLGAFARSLPRGPDVGPYEPLPASMLESHEPDPPLPKEPDTVSNEANNFCVRQDGSQWLVLPHTMFDEDHLAPTDRLFDTEQEAVDFIAEQDGGEPVRFKTRNG